jgi:putative FmdB family regulatory protein
MPIYVYYCLTCKETFEEMWRSTEDYIWPCPICGTSSKRRPCSGLPAIRGETVGQSFSTSRVKDSKGRYRLSHFQEASAELADGYDRIEKREGRKVERPDPYRAGLKEAARRGAKIRRK